MAASGLDDDFSFFLLYHFLVVLFDCIVLVGWREFNNFSSLKTSFQLLQEGGSKNGPARPSIQNNTGSIVVLS